MFFPLIFPARCPGCDRPVAEPGFCRTCLPGVRTAGGAVCMKCGKVLSDPAAEYCRDCSPLEGEDHSFDMARSVYLYEGPVRQGMYRFKYRNRRAYARVYAEEAVRVQGGFLAYADPDLIVPVPMYHPKERQRGYNQAEVFARALSRRTGIPMDSRLLARVRPTAPMKTQGRAGRRTNLLQAFQYMGSGVKFKRILLVDDIYTTGATADACAEVLKRAGIGQVFVLCVCVGRDS